MPKVYPEMTPRGRRKYRKRREREEKRWARLAGPVVVTRLGSAEECGSETKGARETTGGAE